MKKHHDGSIFYQIYFRIAWLACAQPEPVYDSDIDLTAIPIEVGSLDERFALKVRTNAIADLSFLGDLESISDSYWIMSRTYDPDATPTLKKWISAPQSTLKLLG